MPISKNQKSKKYTVRINYTDKNKRHLSKYGTANSYREAKELEKDLYEKRFVDTSITFGNLCEKYIKDSEIRCKLNTVTVIKKIIRKLLITIDERMRIDDLNPSFVRNWQTKLLSEQYSPSYIRRLNATLQSIMNLAVQYYNLPENPVKIAGQIGSYYGKEKRYFTLQEFNKFLTGIDKEKDLSSWVLFNVLFYTGCRIGEALALYPKDINLRKETISISKNFQLIDGTPYITTPKTQNSNRCLKIPHFLCEILKDYIEHLPTKNIRLFFNINYTHLRRVKTKACKLTGIKYIKNHELRHSNITFLISKEVPILEIAKQVGHASPDITYAVYAHLYPNRDQMIADLEDQDLHNWTTVLNVKDEVKCHLLN